MTAFEIPYGYAVYTEPGAIHDDATTQGTLYIHRASRIYLPLTHTHTHTLHTPYPPPLTNPHTHTHIHTLRTPSPSPPPLPRYPTQGTWRVGYINAQTYSTVLLSNKVNDVLEIAFEFERPQLPDWNEGGVRNRSKTPA